MRRLTFFCIIVIFSCLRAAAEQEPLRQTFDANSAEPGYLYFATEKPGRVVRAPRLSADVVITVTGPIVRTRVVQHFTNSGTAWVEGLYTYPLPKGAAVDTLEMKVGNRIITGEIKEKAEAKRTYETAKKAGKRASLIVQSRTNIFSTRLANIGPGETIEIAIEYQDLIEPRDNLFELRFPMVVRPRYIPGVPLDDRQARAGWGFDTDQVPDGSLLTQPWIHDPSGQHNPVSLKVHLAPGFQMDAVESPSHAIDILETENGAEIALADSSVPSDQDFILRWQPALAERPTIGLFKETTPEGIHHLLMVVPSTKTTLESASVPVSRDLIIVLDKSGSMGGQAIRQAKSAVRRALLRLTAKDSFNLIAFDSVSRPLFDQSQPATDTAIESALDFLDAMEAGGGTEMSGALRHALPGSVEAPLASGFQQVIFVTDGAVGNEKALMAQIKDDLGRARLFTIGIGSAPNSYFMEEAAHFGRGTYVNIAMNDDVRAAMDGLFAKIEQPQLTDIKIAWPEGTAPDLDTRTIADLYAGPPIVLTFRTKAPLPTDIALSGRFAGEPWQASINPDKGGMGQGVSKLWARRAIKSINRDHIGRHDTESRKSRRASILNLALGYHLVSDFTSLVAVEQAPARPSSKPLFGREVPANLPAGMDWGKRTVMTLSGGLLAENLPRQGFGAQPVRTRSTATPMHLLLLVGAAFLLLSSLLFLASRYAPARIKGAR